MNTKLKDNLYKGQIRKYFLIVHHGGLTQLGATEWGGVGGLWKEGAKSVKRGGETVGWGRERRENRGEMWGRGGRGFKGSDWQCMVVEMRM